MDVRSGKIGLLFIEIFWLFGGSQIFGLSSWEKANIVFEVFLFSRVNENVVR